MDSFAYFEYVLPVSSIKMRSFCDYVNLRKQFVISGEVQPSRLPASPQVQSARLKASLPGAVLRLIRILQRSPTSRSSKIPPLLTMRCMIKRGGFCSPVRRSIRQRRLDGVVDEVVTSLRGVDAVRADERREDAAFQELRAQIDQTAAERAAQLRDHGVIILLPAVQMVRIAQPVENIFRAQASGDKGEIPLLLQRRQARHGHAGGWRCSIGR